MLTKTLWLNLASGILFVLVTYAAARDLAAQPEAGRDARDDKSPRVLWKVDLASASYGGGAIGDLNGDGKLAIVFGTYFNDEHLYAVDATDGRVLWKFKSEGGPFDASVALADLNGDGRLEVLAADSSTGTLFCLNGAGEVLWKTKLPNSTDSPPAVADLDGDGRAEIVVGTMALGDRHGRVVVLDAATREQKWVAKIPGHVQSEPALVDLNGDGVLDAIVTTWRGDKAVHALDGKTGTELWSHKMDGDIYHGVSVFEQGGTRVVAASIAGDVCLLDAAGNELWTAKPGGYLFAPSTVADLDGDGSPEIIVASGRVHVLDSSGKEEWHSDNFGSIGRGVAIADANGDGLPDLFFGASDRKFRVLEGRTGREIWSYDATVQGHVYEWLDGAPIIADFNGDGTLDVFFVAGKGTSDNTRAQNYGRAVALRVGPGKGSWPMFRGNLRRTGTANARAGAAEKRDHRQQRASFDSDPNWVSLRNRLIPNPPRITRQHFGYRATRRAGGERAGEIGGWVQRSATPAYYARAIAPRSLETRLAASGRFAVTRADNGSGALFGWFHESSRGWRTPNSLAFRIDGNGENYWMLFEYATRGYFAGGAGTFEGKYQTTKSKPFLADGTQHTWSLAYDPIAHDERGEITFVLDGVSYKLPLAEGHKADGAEFNRFGLFNQQTYGDGLDVYLDDVTLDGERFGFDDDPRWEAAANDIEYAERVVRPLHNFGFSPTDHAGGRPGEIGGIAWRDVRPAFYADRVGPFSLDDELHASGRIALKAAASDSSVTIGFFDSAACRVAEQSWSAGGAAGKKEASGTPPRNVLGILIEGPSRIGHYFRPTLATATGAGAICPAGPIIRPNDMPHTWSFDYSPVAGHGRVTFRLDETEQSFDLDRAHRSRGASFDRFGIVVWQPSDGTYVELYLDDLAYSGKSEN